MQRACFNAQPLFDLIAAVAAEAVLRADLAAAAFAARAKLRAAAGAVQMLHALRRAADGTDRHAALVDLVNDQIDEVGKQPDQSPIE